MTDPSREHAHFDELAAGYALHALDPEDDLQFLGHARQCPRCRQSLADYAEVTAALADSALAAAPSEQLADRILAAAAADMMPADMMPADMMPADMMPADTAATKSAVGDGAADDDRDAGDGDGERGEDLPPEVASLRQQRLQRQQRQQRQQHQRRPRRLQVAAAAAAAVLVAGGSIWGGLAASGGGPQAPVAGCVQAHQCHQVQLTDATGHAVVARVIVTGGSVWLVPSGLRADDPARQIYVLWQLTGKHTPLAVGSFDIRGGTDKPIRIGGLAVSYGDTWAFAISLEHGRAIPATPSRPVALGQVLA